MNSAKRKILTPIVQFIVIIAVIAGLVVFAGKRTAWENRRGEIPDGWQLVAENHDVRSLAQTGETIWAGGREGLIAIDRESGLVSDMTIEEEFTYVMALLADDSGNLWIGHDAGLTRWRSRECRTWTTENGLPADRIRALDQSDDGTIWVGTIGGAAWLDGETWQAITSEDGLLEDNVNAIMVDSLGGVWFGSYVAPDGGVSYMKDGEWQYFTRDDGLPHPNVTSFLENVQGGIWVGTGLIDRGGVCGLIRQDGRWEIDIVYHEEDGLAGPKVRSIFQDNSGAIWFGSEYNGVARLDKGDWVVFDKSDGLAQNEVTSIIQDTDGDIWLGTLEGITRISAGTIDLSQEKPDQTKEDPS